MMPKKSGEYQKQRRNKRKEDIIKAKGGACVKCGYNKSASALVFHHRDEKTKKFNISGHGHGFNNEVQHLEVNQYSRCYGNKLQTALLPRA